MRIDVLTLFPGMFGPLGESVLARAARSGALEIFLHDIREYSEDKHRRADDYPFGGGAGMVMTAQPVVDCVTAVERMDECPAHRIYLSPAGKRLDAKRCEELSLIPRLILLCGHYEGIDQRAIDLCIDEEISIGDYVLTGGELPAMVLIDAVSRFVPGVLGSAESHVEESFSERLNGGLEYPHYTRPAVFRGIEVPKILLEGNHALIERWRNEQSRLRTEGLISTEPRSSRNYPD